MSDDKGAPDFEILDGGSPIPPDLRTDVVQVVVDDTLDGASVAMIRLRDDGGARSDGSVFKLGNPVKIELGYMGDRAQVFEGEVTGWRGAFQRRGSQTLTVIAHSKFHRLRRSQRQQTRLNMNDADAVSAAAQAAGLTAACEATPVTHEAVCQWNQTDADFVLDRAALHGYQVRVVGNQLKFEKPQLDQGAAASITWQEQLRSFRVVLSLGAQQGSVKLSSWDPLQKTMIEKVVEGGAERSTMGGTVTGTDAAKKVKEAVTWLPSGGAANQAALDAHAQAVFARRSEKYVEGEGTCEGDPAILAGTNVELEGLGEYLSGPYFVKQAVHTLFPGVGYTTTFRVKRSAVKAPAPPPTAEREAQEAEPKKKVALLDPTWVPPGGLVAEVVAEPQSLEARVGTASPSVAPEVGGGPPPVEAPPAEPAAAPTQTIRFKLEDQDGSPIAGAPFSLKVGDETFDGVTGDDGYVVADVPADAREGELTFWLDEDKSGESYTWPLKISDHKA